MQINTNTHILVQQNETHKFAQENGTRDTMLKTVKRRDGKTGEPVYRILSACWAQGGNHTLMTLGMKHQHNSHVPHTQTYFAPISEMK